MTQQQQADAVLIALTRPPLGEVHSRERWEARITDEPPLNFALRARYGRRWFRANIHGSTLQVLQDEILADERN